MMNLEVLTELLGADGARLAMLMMELAETDRPKYRRLRALLWTIAASRVSEQADERSAVSAR